MKGRSRFRFRYRGIMSALGGIIDTTSKYLLDLFANDFEVANEVSTFNQTIGHSASTNATMTSGYGPELVTNGDFSDGATGWAATSSASISETSGQLSVTGVLNHGAYQVYALPAGTYEFSFNLVNAGGIGAKLMGKTGSDGLSGGTTFDTGYQTSVGVHKFVLEVLAGTSSIVLRLNGTGTVIVDNISVREMPSIKWRPHNLLTYSEDLSNSAWVQSLTPVLTHGQLDPAGNNTATKLELDVNDGIFQTAGNLTGNYTFALWVKGDASGTIRLSDASAGAFNISVNVTTEWTLVSTGSQTISGFFSPYIYRSGGDLATVYVAFPHAYRSDLGGMVDNPDRGDSYVPTTSSAVYLPRRGHHIYNGYEWVNEGMLHESEARTNLVTHSVLDTNWNLSVCTITENDAIAPDGTLTATKLTEGNTDAVHAINANISLPAGDYAISFYGKSIASNKYLIVGGFGLSAAGESPIFDLQNGLVYEPSNNTIYKSAEIEDVGNGWYRGTVRVVSTSTSDLYFQIVQYTAAFGGQQYVGTGTDCFHLWGIQTENTDGQPSSYIPTSGATVTRAAESLTIPAANLPWPTPEVIGSELVTNGTFDTDVSGWVATACSITNNSGVMRITDSDGGIGYVSQTVTLEVGKAYEMSVDVVTDGITGSMILNMGTSGGSGQMASTSLASGTGTISAVFVATQTTGYLNLRNASALAGEFWEVDNVSVKALPGYTAVAPSDAARPTLKTYNSPITSREELVSTFGWNITDGGRA